MQEEHERAGGTSTNAVLASRQSKREGRQSMSEVMGIGSSYDATEDKRMEMTLYKEPSHLLQNSRRHEDTLEYTPGPGYFFGPGSNNYSTISENFRLSKCRTAPSMPIARTGRDSWDGVRISASHKTMRERSTVSAGDYKFDLDTLSKRAVSISREKRFPKRAITTCSPGPAYDTRTTHYQDLHTDDRKCIRFTSEERFRGPGRSAVNVGPGQYDRKDGAVNTDFINSTGFANSKRRSHKKLSTRPDWDLDHLAKEGKGPGEPHWEVLIKPEKAALIPKAQRFSRKGFPENPGPGTYGDEKPPGKVEKTIPVFKFGQPMMKPRLKFDLLPKCKDANWGYF